MAKYNVTYKCGHEERIELYGKHEERYRRLDYLATIDCPACQLAAKVAKAREIGLTGTDRQVAWAYDIRHTAADLYTTLIGKPNCNTEMAQQLYDKMQQHTDSRFWIDNRNNLDTINGLCKMLEKEL